MDDFDRDNYYRGQGDAPPPEPNFGEPQYGAFHEPDRFEGDYQDGTQGNGQQYDESYYYNPYGSPRSQAGRGLSIAAMVLGIVSAMLSSSLLALPPGIVAIILSTVSMASHGANGFNKTGLACGIVGTALSLLPLILGVVLLKSIFSGAAAPLFVQFLP